MVANQLQSNAYLKQYFLVCIITIAIFLCYMGISSRMDIKIFFSSNETAHRKVVHGYGLGYLQTPDIFNKTDKKWEKTSVYEIIEKYKSRTSNNCLNVCNKSNDRLCNLTDIRAWTKNVLNPTFKFVPLLTDFQYIYPFEIDYLSYPPLTDSKLLPDLQLSTINIDEAVDDIVNCTAGSVIKGRVDLVNGYGTHRIMGGDELRVWIVDDQLNTYKAMGHVIDLKNGSYQISIKCLWPGKIQLNVAVAYPREYLRVVVDQIHRAVTWYYAAKFKTSKAEEVTVCSATPNIPGRPCLCNLTSTNQQSLYCGRPFDSRLGCDDWRETYSLPIPQPQHVTPEERTLVATISKAISKNLIPHNITVLVNGHNEDPKLKPCMKTNPAVTWDIDKRPNGYWTPKNKWMSLLCLEPELTAQWATACLKNTNVWVYGDSNGVRLSSVFLNLVATVPVKPGYWPFQFIHRNHVNNINFRFTPSEYPLYLGQVSRKRLPYGGVAKQIDSISSTGAHVIVIHYYLHVAPSHMNIIFLRLKSVHDALERLININPNVIVGIRGPHVSSIERNYNHAVGGDNLGTYLIEMIRYVFRDLRNKIVFLDGWEMTVALENANYHPADIVPFELIRTLLAFKCN